MEDFLALNEQFSEQERLIQQTVQRFVSSEISPMINQAYEEAVFPRDCIPRLAQLGLFGMTLPSEYGCAQTSYVAYGLACQELERGDSGLRSFVSVQSSLCMFPIFAFGSEQQKQDYLPKMAQGECIGCFGLTEADSGSNPAGMKTRAEKVDGGWLLNGSKLWITNATIADIAIVWAMTGAGVRGFVVKTDSEGFQANVIKHKMSMRASDTGELVFDHCFVPDDHFLPGSEKGIGAPLSCLTKARYGIAWGAIGAAQACFDLTLDYCKNRQQFDKPIAAFQLVQKELADMFTEINKAQVLNFTIGKLADQNQLTPVMVSMAKMNAARSALTIARQCRNLLGANGISLEYQVIRHLMNLETVFTYEGTDNIHHLVLGQHVTGINAFS